MIKITDNFNITEFQRSDTAKKYSINNAIPTGEVYNNIYELCTHVLQPLRELWCKPMVISSGYRCEEVNKLVGGSKTSQHMKGQAADIAFNTWQERNEFLSLVKSLNKYTSEIRVEFDQCIIYKSKCIVHISYVKGKNRNEFKELD